MRTKGDGNANLEDHFLARQEKVGSFCQSSGDEDVVFRVQSLDGPWAEHARARAVLHTQRLKLTATGFVLTVVNPLSTSNSHTCDSLPLRNFRHVTQPILN